MKSTARDAIEVVGARTNNLRDATCSFPHGALTVVTGVSGSGKSSLAFDTVYAEGQRRYVETLSTYARQFLQQMKKPPVDTIENLQPALALRQGNSVNNARSTVGSLTELVDFLHLLFAGAGRTICKSCGEPVVPHTVASVLADLRERAEGERVVVVGEAEPEDDQDMGALLRQLVAEGHRRLYRDDELAELDSADAVASLDDEVLSGGHRPHEGGHHEDTFRRSDRAGIRVWTRRGAGRVVERR